MSFDFKKLGMDRMASGIAKSVGTGGGTLVTGDITKGTVVTVGPDFTGNEASVSVPARRTGAILIQLESAVNTWLRGWVISGTTLTVYQGGTQANTYTFWVF